MPIPYLLYFRICPFIIFCIVNLRNNPLRNIFRFYKNVTLFFYIYFIPINISSWENQGFNSCSKFNSSSCFRAIIRFSSIIFWNKICFYLYGIIRFFVIVIINNSKIVSSSFRDKYSIG